MSNNKISDHIKLFNAQGSSGGDSPPPTPKRTTSSAIVKRTGSGASETPVGRANGSASVGAASSSGLNLSTSPPSTTGPLKPVAKPPSTPGTAESRSHATSDASTPQEYASSPESTQGDLLSGENSTASPKDGSSEAEQTVASPPASAPERVSDLRTRTDSLMVAKADLASQQAALEADRRKLQEARERRAAAKVTGEATSTPPETTTTPTTTVIEVTSPSTSKHHSDGKSKRDSGTQLIFLVSFSPLPLFQAL